MTSTVVYVSSKCPNCQRFLDSLRGIPSLQQTVRVHNIDHAPASGVEFVPTLVDSGGQSHVGAKAFQWLQQFQGERDYEAVSLGTGKLSFGMINSSSSIEYASGAFPFEKQ